MSLINWVKKKTAIIGLALGNVEKNALSQTNEGLDKNISQERRHTEGKLMDSLLNGVVTEEVENLRWRMYKIMTHSDGLKSIITGYDDDGMPIVKIVKRDLKKGLNKVSVDTYDKYPVDFVLTNNKIGTDVNTDDDNNISGIEYFATNKDESLISILRDSLPRFQIEDYTTKLIVRNINETEKLLEFYVGKYPDEYNRNSRLFLSEIKKAIANPRTSDMLDFKGVKFITYKAIGVHDFLEYEYSINSFDKIVEFNGSYVVKFKAKVIVNGENILEGFRKDSLDKKYEDKIKK